MSKFKAISIFFGLLIYFCSQTQADQYKNWDKDRWVINKSFCFERRNTYIAGYALADYPASLVKRLGLLKKESHFYKKTMCFL